MHGFVNQYLSYPRGWRWGWGSGWGGTFKATGRYPRRDGKVRPAERADVDDTGGNGVVVRGGGKNICGCGGGGGVVGSAL